MQTLKLIFFKFYIIIIFECIFSPSFALIHFFTCAFLFINSSHFYFSGAKFHFLFFIAFCYLFFLFINFLSILYSLFLRIFTSFCHLFFYHLSFFSQHCRKQNHANTDCYYELFSKCTIHDALQINSTNSDVTVHLADLPNMEVTLNGIMWYDLGPNVLKTAVRTVFNHTGMKCGRVERP